MKRLALLGILILAAAALAGCTGASTTDDSPDAQDDSDPDSGDGDRNDTNGTATPTDGSKGDETDNGTAQPNVPPSASIDADTTSGDAPLPVNFTLDGADADGDALTWSLDADGDGEADAEGNKLPAEVAFTFDAAGNYTANLTVSDGQDTVHEEAEIRVEDAGGDSNEGLPEPITWTATASNGGIGCLVATSSDDSSYFYYDPSLAGHWMYQVDDPGAVSEWWSGEESLVEPDGGGQGVIPAGTDNVAICPGDPVVPAELTLTLHHPDYVL